MDDHISTLVSRDFVRSIQNGLLQRLIQPLHLLGGGFELIGKFTGGLVFALAFHVGVKTTADFETLAHDQHRVRRAVPIKHLQGIPRLEGRIATPLDGARGKTHTVNLAVNGIGHGRGHVRIFKVNANTIGATSSHNGIVFRACG